MKPQLMLYLFAIAILLAACNSAQKENQKLYNQVMDIHDEVMPVTETLYNITKDLKAQLKEVTNDSAKVELEQRIRSIDSVNNMMMDWMRKFKTPDDKADSKEVKAYYESELKKIQQVKEAMLTTRDKYAALPVDVD